MEIGNEKMDTFYHGIVDIAEDLGLAGLYKFVGSTFLSESKEVPKLMEGLSRLRNAALNDVPQDAIRAVTIIETQIRIIGPDYGPALQPTLLYGAWLNREPNVLGPYCLCGYSERNAHVLTLSLADHTLVALLKAGCQAPPDKSKMIEPESVGKNWPKVKAAILEMLDEDIDGLRNALAVEREIVKQALFNKMGSRVLPQSRRKACRWDASEEARNRFIYDEWMEGTHLDEIQAEVNKHRDWGPLNSNNSVKAAAERYARAYDLPPLKPRKQGRPKKAS